MIFQLKTWGMLSKNKNPVNDGVSWSLCIYNPVSSKAFIRFCSPFSGRVQPGGSYGFSGI